MATGEPTPKRITAAELDAVLDQARDEGWEELALIGPWKVDYAELADGVPEARTFVLKKALGPRIAKVASLGALTKLSIRGNGIGDEGVRELGRLTNLTWISVGGNRIGVVGAQALGELRSLTALAVSGNGIGAEGARALGLLNHLTTLAVSGNGIGDEGARALALCANVLETAPRQKYCRGRAGNRHHGRDVQETPFTFAGGNRCCGARGRPNGQADGGGVVRTSQAQEVHPGV